MIIIRCMLHNLCSWNRRTRTKTWHPQSLHSASQEHTQEHTYVSRKGFKHW